MKHIRRTLLLPYHWAWAVGATLFYGRSARHLTVIGVTGTKGKSTVAEMLHAILSESGKKVALASTIRFAVGGQSRPNLYKMTLPGRGFVQAFLRQALRQGATHAVVEITSEGALQYRHLLLELDALVFTNLQKEHIESHGSFEKYLEAKLRVGQALVRSRKRPRIIVANADDPRGAAFLSLPVERRVPFSLSDARDITADEQGEQHGMLFTYADARFKLNQPGLFSVMNALAAIKTAEALGIAPALAARALAHLSVVPGRAERIEAGQDFVAIVDYAHTPDSLRALYAAFPDRRKICVLGNTGGGRDSWKRPEMGRIVDEACDAVILTNEDPYDEDPRAILDAMVDGMKRKPDIIMDRRLAIRSALRIALSWSKGGVPRQARDDKNDVVVLITGKGTDPYIMGAKGLKESWSDAQVVREELAHLRD
ncbi:MAG: UDP-N-acetylmuramyl-tripeptide synthetase [bacterium]|nr:UDP-N-acetylmuramyl-tripeptide synthetase [bacterium]